MAGKEEVEQICAAKGAKEPLEFLAALVAGHDPRELSRIYTMAEAIEEENFGDPPTDEQWEELLQTIRQLYKYAPVGVGVSKSAATTLAEYQHPKRKSIELAGTASLVEVTPLTPEELDLFEEWFHAQF